MQHVVLDHLWDLKVHNSKSRNEKPCSRKSPKHCSLQSNIQPKKINHQLFHFVLQQQVVEKKEQMT
jgi:hypothetical protein